MKKGYSIIDGFKRDIIAEESANMAIMAYLQKFPDEKTILVDGMEYKTRRALVKCP